jgi:hypothetical protein
MIGYFSRNTKSLSITSREGSSSPRFCWKRMRYGPPAPDIDVHIGPSLQLEPQPIIHRIRQVLLRPEILFGGLDGGMAEQ